MREASAEHPNREGWLGWSWVHEFRRGGFVFHESTHRTSSCNVQPDEIHSPTCDPEHSGASTRIKKHGRPGSCLDDHIVSDRELRASKCIRASCQLDHRRLCGELAPQVVNRGHRDAEDAEGDEEDSGGEEDEDNKDGGDDEDGDGDEEGGGGCGTVTVGTNGLNAKEGSMYS